MVTSVGQNLEKPPKALSVLVAMVSVMGVEVVGIFRLGVQPETAMSTYR